MNQIAALMAKFCPDGVDFKSLADVTIRGSNIRWASTGDTDFQYIDLSSVDRITGKIGDTVTIRAEDAPSRAQQVVREGDVIFATTRPTQMRWAVIPAAFDGQIASSGYCVLRPVNGQVLTNFLAHNLGTERFRKYVEEKQVPGNYPSIPDARVREFQIPVPPLEIQQKVVAILDSFAKLEAELEVELEAELEARRAQYRHYRDTLLSFERTDSQASKQATRIAPLSEIGKFTRGRRFTKGDYSANGIGCIHYGDIYTQYGTSTAETASHLRADLAGSLRFAHTGDVVIAAVGETVEDVGKAVAWLGENDVAVHDDCFIFHHNQNPKFVAYCFQTAAFKAEKNRFVARAKVKRLSGESLAKLKIPLPPLEEQAHIVDILDKFDRLVNDLSSGIPAEISARRQQYKHYRDQLMTFKQAA